MLYLWIHIHMQFRYVHRMIVCIVGIHGFFVPLTLHWMQRNEYSLGYRRWTCVRISCQCTVCKENGNAYHTNGWVVYKYMCVKVSVTTKQREAWSRVFSNEDCTRSSHLRECGVDARTMKLHVAMARWAGRSGSTTRVKNIVQALLNRFQKFPECVWEYQEDDRPHDVGMLVWMQDDRAPIIAGAWNGWSSTMPSSDSAVPESLAWKAKTACVSQNRIVATVNRTSFGRASTYRKTGPVHRW